MTEVWQIAKWRFLLMRKQKLGMAALVTGILGIVLCYLVAGSSYMAILKIYWDFVLGWSFAAITFLSIYVSSMIFSDERQRRTLHLLLASGISRRSWLWGNYLGVTLASMALLVVWTLFAALLALSLETAPQIWPLAIQAQLVFAFELCIVIAMTMMASFFLRPVLTLMLSLALVLFLHSQISLLSVLLDQQTGAFNSPVLQPILQYLVPLLPPLEWYDLRVLVGYESPVSAAKIFGLAAMAAAWSLFWMESGLWRFRKVDL